MKPRFAAILLCSAMLGSMPLRAQADPLTGAIVGGLIGNAINGHHGTVAGAVVGAIAGSQPAYRSPPAYYQAPPAYYPQQQVYYARSPVYYEPPRTMYWAPGAYPSYGYREHHDHPRHYEGHRW